MIIASVEAWVEAPLARYVEEARARLALLLHPSGQVVAQAGTVAESIEQARRFEPDIVILDVRLPDGSGIEACESCLLVQLDRGARTPPGSMPGRPLGESLERAVVARGDESRQHRGVEAAACLVAGANREA